MARTALYRHFDAAGALLYVGISLDAIHRLGQHKSNSHWYERIARVDVQWHPSRRDALAAEAIAIASENPPHNKHRPKVDGVEFWSKDRGHSFAILHVHSNRRDGNYFDEADAQDMLRHWSAEYPRETFEIVVARSGDPAWPLGATDGAPKLRAADARLWEAA